MTPESSNLPRIAITPEPETLKHSPPNSESGEDKGKIRLLVYGSLKTQCGNNVLMQRIGAKCLGYDSITGDFRMMSFGGFPGVVRNDAKADPYVATMFGELWVTDTKGLAALDQLESHPTWYERRKYRTDILDKRAWMYTLPNRDGAHYLDRSKYDRVPSGVWQPVEEELNFWIGQKGVEICVE